MRALSLLLPVSLLLLAPNVGAQSGNYPIAKMEASFDYVVCGLGAQVRTYNHLKRH